MSDARFMYIDIKLWREIYMKSRDDLIWYFETSERTINLWDFLELHEPSY